MTDADLTEREGDRIQPVAVLCAARRSYYHSMPDVEVYDIRRDARTFPGGMPVIAHPPCRSWSAFCRHQAKPDPGEAELGLWCARQVERWGGILEQPAYSRLWSEANLPAPGVPAGPLSYSIVVDGFWWGTATRKSTWLYMRGIDRLAVCPPLLLRAAGSDGLRWQRQSRDKRSATPPPLAEWLVALARSAAGNEARNL